MRIKDHPVLGREAESKFVTIIYNGNSLEALEGETIAAALMSHGIRKMRKTPKYKRDRGIFCGIGRCTDCVMVVDGQANVRTCVTSVKDGMAVETQVGYGREEK